MASKPFILRRKLAAPPKPDTPAAIDENEQEFRKAADGTIRAHAAAMLAARGVDNLATRMQQVRNHNLRMRGRSALEIMAARAEEESSERLPRLLFRTPRGQDATERWTDLLDTLRNWNGGPQRAFGSAREFWVPVLYHDLHIGEPFVVRYVNVDGIPGVTPIEARARGNLWRVQIMEPLDYSVHNSLDTRLRQEAHELTVGPFDIVFMRDVFGDYRHG